MARCKKCASDNIVGYLGDERNDGSRVWNYICWDCGHAGKKIVQCGAIYDVS